MKFIRYNVLSYRKLLNEKPKNGANNFPNVQMVCVLAIVVSLFNTI